MVPKAKEARKYLMQMLNDLSSNFRGHNNMVILGTDDKNKIKVT